MKKSGFRIPVFLAVFVGLVTVLAACAPGITRGTAPGGVTSPLGAALNEEIISSGESNQLVIASPETKPSEGLNEEFKMTLEVAPVEGMVEESPSPAITPLLEENIVPAEPITPLTDGQMIDESMTADSFAVEVAPLPEQSDISVPSEEENIVTAEPITPLTDDQIIEESMAADSFVIEVTPLPDSSAASQLEGSVVPMVAPVIPTIKLGSADFVNGDLVVKTQISGFILDPESIGQVKVEGRGHWHLYVDGKLAGLSATDSFKIGKDKLAEFGSGTYDIKIELHNNDHSLVSDTAWASAKIDFSASMKAPDVGRDNMMGGYGYPY